MLRPIPGRRFLDRRNVIVCVRQIAGRCSAAAQRAIGAKATVFAIVRQRKDWIGALSDLRSQYGQGAAVCGELGGVVGQALRLVGKVGEPVDHLDLIGAQNGALAHTGLLGQEGVEVGAGERQKETIDARL